MLSTIINFKNCSQQNDASKNMPKASEMRVQQVMFEIVEDYITMKNYNNLWDWNKDITYTRTTKVP